jgi:hypothetical protein
MARRITYASKRRRRKHHRAAEATRRKMYGRRIPKYLYDSIDNLRIGGVVGVEKKWKDNVFGPQPVPNDWSTSTSLIDPAYANPLNGIVQGVGPEERDGRVTFVHSVCVRYQIQFAAQDFADTIPGGGTDHSMRVFLVLDTQANGTAPTASEVWDNNTGVTYDLMPFRNLSNVQRFKVLKEVKHDQLAQNLAWNGASNSLVSATNTVHHTICHYFKKPLVVNHVGTGSNFASIRDNQLHLFAIANTTSSVIRYTSRIRFTS